MQSLEHHLILGGTGFIGRHVAVLLARAGFAVAITGRQPQTFRFPADVVGRITWKALDFADPDWDRLIAGAGIVHHYAWTSIPQSARVDPAGDLRANVGATIGLLEALKRRGGGRVLFASSGGTVYGKLQRIPADEDHPLAPITAYGVAKATAERHFASYRAMDGLDCRIARIANPYGAGQDPARGLGALTTFLVNALTGSRIDIWGDGEVVRDYIHISDVASCLAMLACTPRSADFVFNVGTGVGTNLNQITAALEIQFQRRLNISRTTARSFDVPVSVLGTDRARRILGWSPRLTLQEGTTRALADLRAGRIFSTLDRWWPGSHQGHFGAVGAARRAV